MLKHELIQCVGIPKICMKSTNEGIGLLTTDFISKNNHFDIDLSPRELKREFDHDIFHIKYLYEVTAKSVHK